MQLNPQNPNHHTTFTQQLQRRRGAARSVPENSPYASASVAQLLQAVPGSLAQLRPNTVGNYQNQQQAGVIGFQTSQQSQSTNNRQQITGQGQVETTQNQAAQLEPPTSQVVQRSQMPYDQQYSQTIFSDSVSTTIHHIPRHLVKSASLPENSNFFNAVNMNMILPH